MTDIINIDLKTPFLRPNYNYILDFMDKEGAVVLVHDRAELIKMQNATKNSGHQIGTIKINDNTWKIYLKKQKKMVTGDNQYNLENLDKIYLEKLELIKKREKISVINRGQGVFLISVYNKLYPEESGKLKLEKKDNGYSIYLNEKKTRTKDHQYDLKNLHKEYTEKLELIKKGEKISVINRGEGVFLMGAYKQYYPEERPKFKLEKKDSGYSVCLKEIS